MIRRIYDEALTQHTAYQNLRSLCKNYGPRLSGSETDTKAIAFSFDLMKSYKFDKVYLQPVKVRHWLRGTILKCSIVGEREAIDKISMYFNPKDLHVCALGGSVGGSFTSYQEIVEVDSISELKLIGEKRIRGRMIFLNNRMDPKNCDPVKAYDKVHSQLQICAAESARYGAVGVLVRSLTLAQNDVPYAEYVKYDSENKLIPALAISANDADFLHQALKKREDPFLYFKTNCSDEAKVSSNNVIGELKGNISPEEIILVGGHLDAWDLGEGANDNGVGCIQSIEALRILMSLGYKPRHTIRCVLFTDGEMEQAGGSAYSEWSATTKQKHLFALEADCGGATPYGFSFSDDRGYSLAFRKIKPILEPYNIYKYSKGPIGPDIGFLKNSGVSLIGLLTNPQRYYLYQHSNLDVFENVNEREMQLGSAAVAALLYLLDQQ